MRIIEGVDVGMRQAHWAYNVWACDDAFDAASRHSSLLLVDAHGWDENSRWVMEIFPGYIVDIEEWLREQPEEEIFLNVCNPGRRHPTPRKKQKTIYGHGIVKGPDQGLWFVAEGEKNE